MTLQLVFIVYTGSTHTQCAIMSKVILSRLFGFFFFSIHSLQNFPLRTGKQTALIIKKKGAAGFVPVTKPLHQLESTPSIVEFLSIYSFLSFL